MMSWVSLLFEASLATLMIALIFYCIKLNKRLSLVRSQNADIADMVAGLREASERAEQSVHHLKSAGLSAERALRSAIEDAAVVQAELARLAVTPPQAAVQPAPQHNANPASPEAAVSENLQQTGREKVKRDMLVAGSAPPGRPKTREEAEETVLQAIRSARVGT